MEHLEGRPSVLGALQARRRRIEVVLLSRSAHIEKFQDILDLAGTLGVPVKRVEPAELDRMAHGRTHGGLMAVCGPLPPWTLQDLRSPTFLLLLEGIDDAQNFGFTLRTAEALGTDGVLLKKHVWDFDPTDVSRASSGTFERLPVIRIEGPEIAGLRKAGLGLWACIANAKKRLDEADFRAPLLLAIGGEKRGLSAAVRDQADGFVRIPMKPGATSLSLSHAAAILLAEVRRQRGWSEDAVRDQGRGAAGGGGG